MLTIQQAKDFANIWLPAWTGNNPEHLIRFYAENTYYLDPAFPSGIQGKGNLLAYFKKLLAKNPNWIWTQIEAIPMQGGFVNKWLAQIPVNDKIIECIGVCLVIFNQEHLITRNEVYFDRTPLFNLQKV